MFPDIYVATPPSTYLGQYIKSYWRYEKHFTDGTIETIFPGSSYELIWVNRGTLYVNGRKMPRLYVGGQASKPLNLSANGLVELWAARFMSWGFAPFADVSQAAAGLQVEASKVVGHESAHAIQRIFEQSNAESFPAALDDYFLDKLLQSRFNSTFLEQANKFLQQNRGKARVKDLAEYCGKSLRQIERNMLASTGRTPSKNMSLIRFEHVRDMLMTNPDTPISHIVERQEYADQSHLIKEFKQYAGMTPGAFARIFKDAAMSFSWEQFQEEQGWGQ